MWVLFSHPVRSSCSGCRWSLACVGSDSLRAKMSRLVLVMVGVSCFVCSCIYQLVRCDRFSSSVSSR